MNCEEKLEQLNRKIAELEETKTSTPDLNCQIDALISSIKELTQKLDQKLNLNDENLKKDPSQEKECFVICVVFIVTIITLLLDFYYYVSVANVL